MIPTPRDVRLPKRPGPGRPRAEELPSETDAEIERRFQEALAVIKRRPRPEPQAWGPSSLAGLRGSGL